MIRLFSNSTRSLAGRCALALAPVVILTAVGVYALRQDRLDVEQRALERLSVIARDLRELLGRALASELSLLELTGNVWFGDGTIGGRVHWPGRSPLSQNDAGWDMYRRRMTEWHTDYPGFAPEDVLLPRALLTDNGRLESPAEYSIPPDPPRWLEELTPAQAGQWETVCRLFQDDGDPELASHALEEFLADNPGPEAAASAEYLRMVAGLADKAPVERVESLMAFARRHWHQTSGSGLTLQTLALGRALEEARPVGLTEELFDRVVESLHGQPSILSPRLIRMMRELAAGADAETQEAVEKVTRRWSAQERVRSLAQQTRTVLGITNLVTTNLWFEHSGQWWWATLHPTEIRQMTSTNGHTVTLTNRATAIRFYPEAVLQRAAALALNKYPASLPPSCVIKLSLEGRGLVPASPLHQEPWVLSRREVVLSLPGRRVKADSASRDGETASLERDEEFETFPSRPRLRIEVTLQDSAPFFAEARRRAWLFGSLMVLAAGVSALGSIGMLRALARERQLNESKTNFVSSVSHELRAPLASVRLMAESLAGGRVREATKCAEYHRCIIEECRRLGAMIENVLDFSRIERGRKQYEFEPTDLAALVRQTVRLMEPRAADRRVRLALDIKTDDTLAPVADGAALQQALVNLLDNAIQHSPADSAVTITLEMETDQTASKPGAGSLSAPAGASRLLLHVSDHGPGIPPGEHERIFERFYRLGSELRRETPGAGIGLSIVKHIVEAHGGRVLVRSAVGEGSRFTMELPLRIHT